MKKRIFKKAVSMLCVLSMLSATTSAFADTTQKRIYYVPNAHLDTVWHWTIQDTIREYLPDTIENAVKILNRKDRVGAVFNFEGAYRYDLVKEYYPELYKELKAKVAEGKWNPVGSMWENGDTMVVAPESEFRQILYGNGFFEEEFGAEKMSKDVFLPDCFGFNWNLPTIAAHSGLISFSTQKLMSGPGWTGGTFLPFDIGKWYGPDGSYLLSALQPQLYTSKMKLNINDKLDGSQSSPVDRIKKNLEATDGEYGSTVQYFGVGDRGIDTNEQDHPYDNEYTKFDSSYKEALRIVNKDQGTTYTYTDDSGATQTVDAYISSPWQFATDMTEAEKAALPKHETELPMKDHGVGNYTSVGIGKRWNAKNELLADAAERSNVLASWLGGKDYPQEELEVAWKRFLAHQFHDDLPGTSIPAVWKTSFNDYVLSMNQFAEELKTGTAAVTRAMNTKVNEGIPVVVQNSISADRQDIVEATVTFDEAPEYVKVYNGEIEVASQILSKNGNEIKIAFLAEVPANGYKTYNVRPSDSACNMSTEMSATKTDATTVIENSQYKVTINNTGDNLGDISSIIDKANENKELLSEPIKLGLINNSSKGTNFGAWEIYYTDLYENGTLKAPAGFVGKICATRNPKIEIVENGPARVAVKITRASANSSFEQIVSLGRDSRRVDVDNVVNWNDTGRLLKAYFPLSVSNAKATYDLGLGAIERENSKENYFEFAAQKWADITNSDGSYGVSILSDSKNGWDKPSDNMLRLTLTHSAASDHVQDGTNNKQTQNDYGENRFAFAIFGHDRTWQEGNTQYEAAAFSQPLTAYQTESHEGSLGAEYSFASVNTSQVMIKAIKKAEKTEKTDEIIVRVHESWGQNADNVELTMGNGIESAREVNGYETEVGPATVVDGKLRFSMTKYQPKTFALTLKDPTDKLSKPSAKEVELKYNMDVISSNASKEDGDGIGPDKRLLPAEILPSGGKIVSGGVEFKLGSTADGANNAVKATGQTISLDGGYNKLNLLVASANNDKDAEFTFNNSTKETINVKSFTERVGTWDLIGGGQKSAYLKHDTVGFVSTHTHIGGKDGIYAQGYLFKYTLDIPEGATSVTLPNDENIVLFAATQTNEDVDVVAATSLYDERDKETTYQVIMEGGTDELGYSVTYAKPGDTVNVKLVNDYEGTFEKWVSESELVSFANGASKNTSFKMPEEDVVITRNITPPLQLGENLALKAKARAKAEVKPDEAASKAIDGDVKTKWCDNKDGGIESYLVLDFGKPVLIDYYVIKHAEAGGENASLNTKDYHIQISNVGDDNNENWTTVETVTGNTKDITENQIGPVITQYVRLVTVTPISSGNGAARIYEFELYNTLNGTNPDTVQCMTPEVNYSEEAKTIAASVNVSNATADTQDIMLMTAVFNNENRMIKVDVDRCAELKSNEAGKLSCSLDDVTLAPTDRVKLFVVNTATMQPYLTENNVYGITKLPGTTNIALPKYRESVVGNYNYNDTENAEKAVDGIWTTKWSGSRNDTNEDDSKDKTLTLTYAEPKTIANWRVIHAGHPGSTDTSTKDYITLEFCLEYSLDGTNWIIADYVENNTATLTERNLDKPFTAKYVRLRVIKARQNGAKDARIPEFEVYEAADGFGLINE